MAKAYKSAKKGSYDDRHHAHMARHYKETPWWWYVAVLVFSFVLGLVVVIKGNISLPVWAYIVSLVLGIVIAPFVSILIETVRPDKKVSSDAITEHSALLSLRKWYCHKQPLKDVGRFDDPWTTCW